MNQNKKWFTLVVFVVIEFQEITPFDPRLPASMSDKYDRDIKMERSRMWKEVLG